MATTQAAGEQSRKFDARRAFELNLRPSQILNFRVRREQRSLLNFVLFTPRVRGRRLTDVCHVAENCRSRELHRHADRIRPLRNSGLAKGT